MSRHNTEVTNRATKTRDRGDRPCGKDDQDSMWTMRRRFVGEIKTYCRVCETFTDPVLSRLPPVTVLDSGLTIVEVMVTRPLVYATHIPCDDSGGTGPDLSIGFF